MYKTIISNVLNEQELFLDLNLTTDFILSVQKSDGEIPWSIGGKTDPWDHIESAMGLTIGGCFKEAKNAYIWSANNQLYDGSWWSEYMDSIPKTDAYKDTNMTAYIAVGVLHYYLAAKDKKFLKDMWLTIEKAMDYIIKLQGQDGEIFWAKRKDDSIDETALLTGSSSIYMSLNCAIKIASILGYEKPDWKTAKIKIKEAILFKPFLFDQSKSRYSMDWYYPILCGVITGKNAQKRIEKYWDTFIIAGWGVRCVSDQPWLTMAETSEFVMTLASMGKFEAASMIFDWISDKKYEDGSFWTGVTFPDKVIYTTDKTAWTAAAVLLAADMLYELTSANTIFCHNF